MRRIALAFVCITLLGGSISAADDSILIMDIHRRAIESSMLKYRLLPAETEIIPGNAAPILLRLPWQETNWMNEHFDKLSDWVELPLAAPEWKTSDGVLPENFYLEMRRAAYRRDAHWEYPIHETSNPYLILLPDVQGLRGFLGNGLAGRIRYNLTRGELDKAREGILMGLANSRHLAQTPFYINQLVALGISDVMLARVEELISQPKSPNLYWALTMLPPSLLELDRAANFEGHLFATTVPLANELDRPRDAAEWRKMALQLTALLEEAADLPQKKPANTTLQRLVKDVETIAFPPLANFSNIARPELPKLLNIPAEKVAKMTDDEVAIRWYVYRRQTHDQLLAAAMVLPPEQAWPLLKEVQAQAAALEKAGVPRRQHLSNIYFSIWSFRRKVAALRIIEAVRDYMATHDGKLPEKLDAIQGLPIPHDPITSQPFVWKVQDGIAMLSSPPLPANAIAPSSERANLEYRLQVK